MYNDNNKSKRERKHETNVYKFKMISINVIQLNIVVSRKKTFVKVREINKQIKDEIIESFSNITSVFD